MAHTHFYAKYMETVPEGSIDTEVISIGPAMDVFLSASLAKREIPDGPIWVLSDQRTEAAFGSQLRRAIAGSGRGVTGPVLPADPKPQPTAELCSELEPAARGSSLLIAVGGGTISDIVKKISAEVGVANWCAPTAPSVDAFTSAKSALRIRGYHRTPFVTPSEVVACDLDVLQSAPLPLLFAGAGDLLAKYFAFIDWTLSQRLTGEGYDATDAEFALESARRAIDVIGREGSFSRAVVEGVTDASLTSGLIMQKRRNSRAAASSEHTVAHFWEASHAVSNQALDLHGVLVAAASRLVIRAYSWFIETLPTIKIDVRALEQEYARSPNWRMTVAPEMEPYLDKMEEEMADRDFSLEAYRARLSRISKHRDDIVELCIPLLSEIRSAVGVLQDAGFPFSYSVLGLDSNKALSAVTHVRYLRNRYGIFDIAADLGLWPRLLAKLPGWLDQCY